MMLSAALCCALLDTDAERMLTESPEAPDARTEADKRSRLATAIRQRQERTPDGFGIDLDLLATDERLMLYRVVSAQTEVFQKTREAMYRVAWNYIETGV
jgi:hypothetical protein